MVTHSCLKDGHSSMLEGWSLIHTSRPTPETVRATTSIRPLRSLRPLPKSRSRRPFETATSNWSTLPRFRVTSDPTSEASEATKTTEANSRKCTILLVFILVLLAMTNAFHRVCQMRPLRLFDATTSTLRGLKEFKPYWYDSSLLHSNFQSWQMRSLPTLDNLKNSENIEKFERLKEAWKAQKARKSSKAPSGIRLCQEA